MDEWLGERSDPLGCCSLIHPGSQPPLLSHKHGL
jgi:hypothetical protein